MSDRARRLILTLVVAASLSAYAVAEDRFEQITVAGTAIGFTTSKIEPAGQPQAQMAACRVRTAEISFTFDGTTPTATVGTLAGIGDMIYVPGHDRLRKFLAIKTGSTSGQLDCNYTP